MIYWITGKSGAGKTTLAKKMMAHWACGLAGPCVLLDGDHLREHFPSGFSPEERESLIMTTARIAALLEDQGFTVIVAKISGRKKWRQEARKLFKKSKLIYVPGGTTWPDNPYEVPDREELEHG